MDRGAEVKVKGSRAWWSPCRQAARFFMMALRIVFAESHHGDRTDYFFAVLAGSAFAGLAALAVLPFSSVTITSLSLSPVFSGKWVPAGAYCASPAFTAKSCFFPSGKVKVPLASVRNTATVLGWLCITDFSCGP